MSLFAEFATSETPPHGEDLVSEIREALSPLYFVSPDICKKLSIYGKVKLFLERYGVSVPSTEESGTLVAKKIICRIWNDEEFIDERKDAFTAFDEFQNGKKIKGTTSSDSNYTRKENDRFTPPSSNTRQISNDVAKRLMNDSSKFSGESTECWPKYVENYSRISMEMELTADMQVKLFHHLLKGHALEFFRDNIEVQFRNFEDVLEKMNDEFCSSVKMETIARTLEAMHISQFEEDGKSEEAALSKMAKEIQELNPQAPEDCRTDRYRKKILYNATRGRKWALHISSSTNFLNLSYQQLLHELQNSLQQYSIHETHTKSEDEGKYLRSSRIADTNFTGQGRYMPFRGNSYKNNRRSDDRLNKCWNCSKTDCSVNRCPFPKNPKKIRINCIKHFEARRGSKFGKKVTETLLQFCEEYIDDELPTMSDSSASSDDGDDVSDDENTLEIHHLLSENRANHKNSLIDTLDF